MKYSLEENILKNRDIEIRDCEYSKARNRYTVKPKRQFQIV